MKKDFCLRRRIDYRLRTVSVVITLLLVASCKPRVRTEKTTPVESSGLKVAVSTVTQGPITNTLTLSGILGPSEQVAVISKVSGRLVQVNVREGGLITRDEVIALVNRDEPGQEFKDYLVKAPISGVVAKVMFDAGAFVSPATPIALLMNISNLKVTVNVIESELRFVRRGLSAEVTVPAYPERVFAASVSNILPTVDPVSHTAKVELTVPNSSGILKPGMSAKVRLILDRHENALLIPKSAIIEKLGEKYVFVYDNGLARHITISTGYDDGTNVEVLSGIKPGDRIITTELNVLKDGSRVRVQD